MKILVTGSGGLVGSALKELINIEYTNHEYVFLSRADCNLLDERNTIECFKYHSPDIVVHLASIVNGANDGNQLQTFIDNVKINTNVFQSCIDNSIKKIIVILSVVLGNDTEIITEHSFLDGPTLDLRVHEGYIHSKRVLQVLSNLYTKQLKGHIVTLVPVNIYGYQDIGKSTRIIPSLYNSCINNQNINLASTSYRQLLYNNDLAHIINNFATMCDTDFIHCSKLYIVGNPELLKIQDVTKIILECCNMINNSLIYNESNNYSREVIISTLPFEFKYTPFKIAFSEICSKLTTI